MTTGNSPAVTDVTAACSADQFKAGMRRFASGVTLITATHDDMRAGRVEGLEGLCGREFHGRVSDASFACGTGGPPVFAFQSKTTGEPPVPH